MAVHLTFKKGRIGEKRRCNRLQSQSHAKFLHHVCLRGKIEINLHRTGAAHHRAAHCTHLAHIGIHQPIAAFGHQADLFMGPDRRSPKTDKANTDFIGNVFHLAQVHIHLVTGLMNGFKRCSRKLQRSARLKAYIRAVFGQSDKIAIFLDRRPIEPIAQTLQNGKHRAFAFIGQWGERIFAIAEFFMFRANSPIAFRLIALFKQQCQLVKAFDRASARLWNRHWGDSAFRNLYPSQVASRKGQVKIGLMKFPTIALPDEK